MSKYAPLGDHLRIATGDELVMTFDQIEEIIGTDLPPSASKHDEWWQNSAPGSDSHVQALAWMTTGWRKLRVDRAARYVTFSRAGSNPESFFISGVSLSFWSPDWVLSEATLCHPTFPAGGRAVFAFLSDLRVVLLHSSDISFGSDKIHYLRLCCRQSGGGRGGSVSAVLYN